MGPTGRQSGPNTMLAASKCSSTTRAGRAVNELISPANVTVSWDAVPDQTRSGHLERMNADEQLLWRAGAVCRTSHAVGGKPASSHIEIFGCRV